MEEIDAGAIEWGVQVNDPEDGVTWELGRQGTVEWWVRGCWAYGAQDHRTHKMQLCSCRWTGYSYRQLCSWLGLGRRNGSKCKLCGKEGTDCRLGVKLVWKAMSQTVLAIAGVGEPCLALAAPSLFLG